MTSDERAALEAEAASLIAELRRRREDPGTAGIPHTDFTAHWRGRRVEAPAAADSEDGRLPGTSHRERLAEWKQLKAEFLALQEKDAAG